jgi:hypothetical protein
VILKKVIELGDYENDEIIYDMNRCELPVVVMVKLTPEQYNKIRKDQTSRRRQKNIHII